MYGPAASTKSMKVRPAVFEDYPRIVALQAGYGLEYKAFDDWKRLWAENPAYIAHEHDLPIGWVLERDDKYIAGYLGNIPLFYELQNETILASVAHSWVVDSQYRSYALLLLEEYFSQAKVQLFLNATVGPAASDSFGIFQSLPVPAGKWDHSSFWISNYSGFLKGWLALKGKRLAKPLVYAISAGLFLKGTFFGRAFRNTASNIQLRSCKQFDEEFDVFWEKLRRVSPAVLRGVRSREVLNWHFHDALRDDKLWIVTAGNPDIATYAIFLRHDNPKYGLKRLRLIDFQSLDGSANLLLPMLSWALKRCKRESIHMLECIGFRPDKQDLIAKVAPYERKLPSWLYFYRAAGKGLAQRLSNSQLWDPSQFDGDASL